MIRVIEGWYIDVGTEPICYTVKRGDGIKDEKGRCKDKPNGYFTTLRGAIKHIHKQVCAERLANGSHPLSDAIRTISDIEMELEKALEGVTI